MLCKLIDRYKNLQPPVKASLWFLLCGFLQKGISMLTTPIFTRIMTDTEYGQFTVYNSWLSIVQIVVSLNLAAGVYTRGLVKYEGDQDRFASSMLGLSTTCILLWSVIYAIFFRQINGIFGLSTVMMAAMIVETWSHAAYQFWSNRERVHYRYKKLVWLTLAYVILRPLIGVVFVLTVESNSQMEARVLATVGVNAALFSGLYFSITRKGRRFFDRQYWVSALKFNLPLIPHYLSQIVLSQSDRLMINRICGPEQAAYYSVAYTVAMVLQILNNSISATMNPWIYKSLKRKTPEKIGAASYMILLLIAALNVAVILVAPEILRILAPARYQTAIWVIPPVTVSVYFMFLYNLFATFEYYYGKTHYVTAATLAGALLNILLNALLIPRFGFVAAGYTTLVCYMLYSFIHYYFMRKICGMFLDGYRVYDEKIIIGIGAALVIVATGVTLLYKTILIRYLLLCVIGVFAVAERKKVLELLRKLKQR